MLSIGVLAPDWMQVDSAMNLIYKMEGFNVVTADYHKLGNIIMTDEIEYVGLSTSNIDKLRGHKFDQVMLYNRKQLPIECYQWMFHSMLLNSCVPEDFQVLYLEN